MYSLAFLVSKFNTSKVCIHLALINFIYQKALHCKIDFNKISSLFFKNQNHKKYVTKFA